MNKTLFSASSKSHQELQERSRSCCEIWNMALSQRRNKYSWGKANAQTQIEEIAELKALEPSFSRLPDQTLAQVFQDLEIAFSEFLKANQAFKRHQIKTQPNAPQPLAEDIIYPQCYAASDYTYESDKLHLKELSLIPEGSDTICFSDKIWVCPINNKNVMVHTKNPLYSFLQDTSSSKEAGLMALKEANSTKGTGALGSSPRG